MANHASTRTTQLYDQRRDDISLDEVERIYVNGEIFYRPVLGFGIPLKRIQGPTIGYGCVTRN